ncbi:MAG: hypothetical protein WDW36_002252 [Sanguina aurantia]
MQHNMYNPAASTHEPASGEGRGRGSGHSRGRRGGGNRGGGRWGGRHHGDGGHFQQQNPAPQQQQGSAVTLDFTAPAAAASLTASVKQAVDTYVQRLQPLVEAELQAERDQVTERLRRWPISRLCKEGLVLCDVAGSKRGSYFGRSILRFGAADGGELPFHRFNAGDLVTMARSNPLDERCEEALVLDKHRGELRVVADCIPRELGQGLWRIDKGVNLVTYKRMAAAMRSLYKEPGSSASIIDNGGGGGSSHAGRAGSSNQAGGSSGQAGGSGSGNQSTGGSDQQPQHGAGGRQQGGCSGGQDIGSFHGGSGSSGSSGQDVGAEGYSRGGGGGSSQGVGAPGRGRPATAGQHHGPHARQKRRGEDDEEDDGLPAGTHIRDVLLGDSTARGGGSRACYASGLLPAAAAAWAAACTQNAPSDPAARHPSLPLNRSQVHGIATAMQHRVCLLQGPPGTGKTTTIVQFLRLLKKDYGFAPPVLACASSHVAVDNLLEGLVECGVKAVRLGQPVKSLSAILSGSGKRSVRRRAAKASQVTRPGRAGRCDGAGSEATSSELAVGTVTAQDPAVM